MCDVCCSLLALCISLFCVCRVLCAVHCFPAFCLLSDSCCALVVLSRFVYRCVLFAVHWLLFFVGCWVGIPLLLLLVVVVVVAVAVVVADGSWLYVLGLSLFVVRCWLLVVGCWLCVCVCVSFVRH